MVAQETCAQRVKITYWCRFLCVGIAFGPITYRASLKGKKAGGLADGIDVWFLGSEVYENVMDLGKKNN